MVHSVFGKTSERYSTEGIPSLWRRQEKWRKWWSRIFASSATPTGRLSPSSGTTSWRTLLVWWRALCSGLSSAPSARPRGTSPTPRGNIQNSLSFKFIISCRRYCPRNKDGHYNNICLIKVLWSQIFYWQIDWRIEWQTNWLNHWVSDKSFSGKASASNE